MNHRTSLYQTTAAIIPVIEHIVQSTNGTVVIICSEREEARQWLQRLKHLTPVLIESRRAQSVRQGFDYLLQHQSKLLIGTKRLALLPLTEAAQVIIIDPENPGHEQWDQKPRYHVLAVAEQQGPVLCLSQAPRVEQVLHHQIDTDLLDESLLPDIVTVHPSSIREVIARHEQIVVWHNRTGVARYAICQSCQRLVPDAHATQCPQCGSADLRLGGFGTGALVQRLQETFPDRSVVEVTSQTRQVELKPGSIFIGTNAIFSRIPWDQVTAAIATSIDAQLAFPDYRSHEQTLQQLIHLRNLVRSLSIATYAPEHPVVQAVRQAYPAQWYSDTILARKRFHYL